jgi:hypothetical protein
MANPTPYIRLRSAGLLAAVLAVALLGCGAQPSRDAGRAPGVDTSALPATARAFLSTLNARQRAVATSAFGDPERTRWAYVPQARAGIPLKDMDAEQRAAAFGVLGTGLSERGTRLARGVIELEGTLRVLEGALSGLVGRGRDPELYHLTLFVGPWWLAPLGLALRGPSPLGERHGARPARPDRRPALHGR